MPRQSLVMLVLLLVWAALFAASFIMPSQIEGPRSLDTGFQRLDVFTKYQFWAFGVAIVALAVGIVWRKDGRRNLLLGLIPVLCTALLVLAFFVAGFVLERKRASDQSGAPTDPPRPPTQAAPAID